MTPQLILTLSPSGALQIELPAPNGSRRIVSLSGDPSEAIAIIHRTLQGQLTGHSKVGEPGAPTAQEVSHFHHKSFTDGCPFCNLGLRHSQNQCNNASSSRKPRLSPRTRAIVAAFEPPVDPTSLGF